MKNNKNSQFLHLPCNCSKIFMEKRENDTGPQESARLLDTFATGLPQRERGKKKKRQTSQEVLRWPVLIFSLDQERSCPGRRERQAKA